MSPFQSLSLHVCPAKPHRLPLTPVSLRGVRQRFDTRSRGRLSQTSLVLLTQASCYRFSAMEVMHKLINSTAHFVRCVRPNGDGAADTWDTGELGNQALRTRQLGYLDIGHRASSE